MSSCLRPHGAAARQDPLSFTISWSLLKSKSIESVMPSNHLILYHPLNLLPSVFPRIRVFSKKLALHIRGPKYWSLLRLTSVESVMPSNQLILCCPLLLLPSVFLSISLGLFQCFSINPFNEYSGLISFRIDWLDLLAVPGALKSLL